MRSARRALAEGAHVVSADLRQPSGRRERHLLEKRALARASPTRSPNAARSAHPRAIERADHRAPARATNECERDRLACRLAKLAPLREPIGQSLRALLARPLRTLPPQAPRDHKPRARSRGQRVWTSSASPRESDHFVQSPQRRRVVCSSRSPPSVSLSANAGRTS